MRLFWTDCHYSFFSPVLNQAVGFTLSHADGEGDMKFPDSPIGVNTLAMEEGLNLLPS